MNAVKHEFVRRILLEEKPELTKAQLVKINKLLNIRSGNLAKRDVEIISGNTDMDGSLVITHPAYERFLDMRKKSLNSKKLKSSRKNNPSTKKQNSFPIHNAPIMSRFNVIGNKLLYFLTEDVYKQIENDLKTM